jgi:hypothetical protein
MNAKITFSLVGCYSYTLPSYPGLMSLSDDVGTMPFRNVGNDQPDYTVSYSRTQHSINFKSNGFRGQ